MTDWPEEFMRRMNRQLGAEAGAFWQAMARPYERGVRLNPGKPAAVRDAGEPVPWYPALGRYLPLDSAAGAEPLHEAGAYYLQEPSAMAPVAALSPKPGERVLDLCAAPGGKSTQIAAALGADGLLVCNEPVPARARVLSRNVERMGVTCALVVSAAPEALARLWPGVFDAVLVDAPCSGEGMFRRHPEAALEWNERSAEGCAARQKHILRQAARMLRAGGRLAYSTCTFSPEENEGVVEAFLAAEPGFAPLPFSLGGGLDAPAGQLRLYPHRVRGEGHFVALFVRRDAPMPPASLNAPPAALARPDAALLRAYGALEQDLGPLPKANAQLGQTLVCAPPLPPLQGVRVLRAGLHLGAMCGKVCQPDHALALGSAQPLRPVPLDRAQALAYQSGQALPAPETLRGYVTPTYEGLALGFAKASGGQLKNHYPKGLRRAGLR